MPIYLKINNLDTQFLIYSFSEYLIASEEPQKKNLNIQLVLNGQDLIKKLGKYCKKNSLESIAIVNDKEKIYESTSYDHIENLNISFSTADENSEITCNLLFSAPIVEEV